MQNERRKHSRLPLRHDATVTFIDGSSHQGRIGNISFGGCFVECASLAGSPRRDQCFLSILLPGAGKTIIRIDARLAWANPSGVGLCFLRIELDDYQHFQNMMVANSADPDQLLAELEKSPGLEIVGE